MDEESLFRDIHNHLIHQAQEGGKMDTEMKLAERFNVSRYRVRRVLDILTRMGIIHRAQKRGLTVLDPEPEKLSKNIGSQLTVSGFNAMEDLEARMLIEHAVLELAVKRLTPMTAGRLTEKVGQLERVMISRAAGLCRVTAYGMPAAFAGNRGKPAVGLSFGFNYRRPASSGRH